MQNWNVRVVAPPDQYPVSLEEAKRHLIVEIDDDDELIESYVAAATSWCEQYCNRVFCQTTLELTMDRFPPWCNVLELTQGEVQSVESVKYYDVLGELQTWPEGEYLLDGSSLPARVEPAPGFVWPAAQIRVGAIKVRYQAGYAPGSGSPTDYAANIPRAIKQAILLLVGQFYEHRENVVIGATPAELPMATQALLWPFRILRG